MKLVPVKYSGRKPYTDKTALRNRWEPGDTKLVPDDCERVLLRFAEFGPGKESDVQAVRGEAEAAVVAQEKRKHDEQNEAEGMLNLVETMDKDALEAYAAKYEVNLDKRRGVATLRSEVVSLIEQFGVR